MDKDQAVMARGPKTHRVAIFAGFAVVMSVVSYGVTMRAKSGRQTAGQHPWTFDDLGLVSPADTNGWFELVENDALLRDVAVSKPVVDFIDHVDFRAPDWRAAQALREPVRYALESHADQKALAVFKAVAAKGQIVEDDCPRGAACPATGLWQLHRVASISVLQSALTEDWPIAFERLRQLLTYDLASADGARSSVRLLFSVAGAEQTLRVLSLTISGLEVGPCMSEATASSVTALSQLLSSRSMSDSGARRSIIREYLYTRTILDTGCPALSDITAGKNCESSLPGLLYSKQETIADADAYYLALMRYVEGRGDAPLRLDRTSETWWWTRNAFGKRLLTAVALDHATYIRRFIEARNQWLSSAGAVQGRLSKLTRCPE